MSTSQENWGEDVQSKLLEAMKIYIQAVYRVIVGITKIFKKIFHEDQPTPEFKCS